ncbi:Na+/H+ antiporter NhaC [Thiohalorhabdus methylotrophus]|uniref:Na+/H+ antiporter NhaC n=1 Tax=Thiohalorhabdus methylotrophus TaxID=3242694 RepID=A0ABV4TVN0_9GAMM
METANAGAAHRPRPSLALAVLPIAVTMGLMLLQLAVLDEFAPQIPLALGIAFTGFLAWTRGFRWKDMETGLFHVVHIGLPSVAILMTVGMIIGTWILSGTVPLLIYYGLQLITPQFFLLAAMLIPAVVSVAIGTSWGTVGTVGLALVGIGEGLGIPAAYTGGAIVSGAFFGDKMSPLSDTTNLAPAVTATNLFSHIRNMMATAVPAMLAAGTLFWVLGLQYAGQNLHTEQVRTILAALEERFTFHPALLLPALLVVVLAVRRFPAIPTLFAGVLAGAATALIAQGASFHQVFVVMQEGFSSTTGVAAVDELLSKGGIQSMMWTISLVLIALAFGGIVEQTRCLEVILNAVMRRVRGRFSLVTASTGGAVGTNLITGDPYLSIALPGRMFSPAYRGQGLSTLNLSRSIEEGGTLINPLVPWSAGGAFTAGALGIPTLAYAPFAVACWLSPLIGLLFAALGWYMPRASDAERAQWQRDEEPVMVAGEMVSAAQLDPEGLERAFDAYRRE